MKRSGRSRPAGADADTLAAVELCVSEAVSRRRSDSPGLGLGLPLISQTARELDVRTPRGGGTELLMRFELSGERVPDSAA